ncbi:MAG: shikimate kinase [Bacteroidota bacterium]
MKQAQRVYLIGFMGAGKTTIGRQLAQEMGWHFLDLDDWIEEQAGKSIPEVFREAGEAAFRQMERQAIEATAQLFSPHIIACGGGTPCQGDNMARLNELGLTIYLQQSPQELTRRLLPFRAHRPMISQVPEAGLQTFIADLLAQREPYYLQAQHHFSPSDAQVQHIHELLRFSTNS